MRCACLRDDALDCAQARYGDTDEPCDCCCHAAIAEEREACAKIADANAAQVTKGSCSWGTASLIAEAIRNRKT
jgi:hypothetical protein